MFANQYRQLNDAELVTKFLDLKEELFNLRFQNATSSLEKHNLIPALKKDIARVETVLTERNLTATGGSSERTFAGSEGSETESDDESTVATKKKVK